MQKKSLSNGFIITANILILALLIAVATQQFFYAREQKELLENTNKIVMSRIDELETNIDPDTIAQIKDCELKAMQTVINIFSPQEITKDSQMEYQFNYFSDDAYQTYLEQHRTWQGQQLVTQNINGSGYDARTEKINVFVWFQVDQFETRTSYSFTFVKSGEDWIIESIGADS
ncbi:MAG: hypothetical protein RR444_12385 [Oscillospiraceae bacterium]